MRAAVSGDKQAYHRFLTSVTPALRMMVRRRFELLGVPQNEVEDVVQEALLTVHVKRATWDTGRAISPWLATVVRNKMIDHLRRLGRNAAVPLDDVIAQIEVDDRIDPMEDLDIGRMLQQMKEPQRAVVHALSVEGSSVREIAARLKMTEGAVRVAFHRGLKALSALYRSGLSEDR
jgi:RNA polymerase sigma-70 factor (ECF subfamily)